MARDVRVWFGGNSLTAGSGIPTHTRSRVGAILRKVQQHVGPQYKVGQVVPAGAAYGGSIGSTLLGWLRWGREYQPHIVFLQGGENDQGADQCAALGNSLGANSPTINLGTGHAGNLYEIYDANDPTIHEWVLATQSITGSLYRNCRRGLGGTASRAWQADAVVHNGLTLGYTGNEDDPTGEPCWLRRMRVLIREVVGSDPDRPHPITVVSGLWFQNIGARETNLLRTMVTEDFINKGFRVAFCPWNDPTGGPYSIYQIAGCRGPAAVTLTNFPNNANALTVTIADGFGDSSAFDGDTGIGIGDAVLVTTDNSAPAYNAVEGCIVAARPAANQLTLTRSKFGTGTRVVTTGGATPVYIGYLANAAMAPTEDYNVVLNAVNWGSGKGLFDGHPTPKGAELMAQAEVEAVLPLLI